MDGSTAGKIVNECSAMRMTAVYACVRILSEAIASLPLPKLPDFPVLTWVYENRCYCISESYADLLLNYCGNQVPQYRFQVQKYKRQLQVVSDALCYET